jgi:hypothetical protein
VRLDYPAVAVVFMSGCTSDAVLRRVMNQATAPAAKLRYVLDHR